jgi:hypothetical protein
MNPQQGVSGSGLACDGAEDKTAWEGWRDKPDRC